MAILFAVTLSLSLFILHETHAYAKEVTHHGAVIDLPPQSDKTWIMMDPLQCPEYISVEGMKEWSKNYNNATYPIEQGYNDTSITNYYQRQGIPIFDQRLVSWTDSVVCSACGCPIGDTLYLLVSNSNVDKMEKYGYTVALGPVNQSPGSTSNQTNNKTVFNSGTVSIISIQPTDQQGNAISSFAKGTNGFVKVTLASQSNQIALTTVDLIGSDLTSLGVGSVKTILNQTGSEMTLSFFIPEFTANGVSNICVDVFSDWPAKGGIPLATESCQEAQMSVSTNVSSNKTIGLQEEIRLDDSLGSNNNFGCISSPSNKTEEIQLSGDNYLQQTVTITSGQRLAPLLVQKVCPDHVEGKQFFSNPLCCPSDPVKMYVGDSVGGPCDFGEQLTLLQIQGSKAIFSFKIFGGARECPICLSGDTNINTPNGTVNVKELKTGMSVWTSDLLGHRQFATILKTGKTLVPLDHKMVHIVLADGRELYASEGHPTSDGRLLGELAVGDILDHSQIKSIELASYNENYTYDILPSGTTGYYWANGILVGSTLK